MLWVVVPIKVASAGIDAQASAGGSAGLEVGPFGFVGTAKAYAKASVDARYKIGGDVSITLPSFSLFENPASFGAKKTLVSVSKRITFGVSSQSRYKLIR